MSVSIQKGEQIVSNIKRIFTELNFSPGQTVFVKPNLCGRFPILAGENTSLKVMDALIEVLSDFGCQIIIGHSSLLGTKEQKVSFSCVMKSSGFIKYGDLANVTLLDLDTLERTAVDIDEMEFHLPIKFLKNDIDTYINLAKIKTHMETTVSFCLKNQMGLPTAVDRSNMHRTDLEKTIAKLTLFCRPDINLLEGYPAMENNGPHHGTPRHLNIIAGGRDMVELDSFMYLLLGYEFDAVDHVRMAESLGVGRRCEINIIDRFKKFKVKDFKKASNVHRFGFRFFAYPTYSCSCCILAVNSAGREFRNNPLKFWRVIFKSFFSLSPINIIFGKADHFKPVNNGKFICIGKCAKQFAREHGVKCLDKCPPSIDETLSYIEENLRA